MSQHVVALSLPRWNNIYACPAQPFLVFFNLVNLLLIISWELAYYFSVFRLHFIISWVLFFLFWVLYLAMIFHTLCVFSIFFSLYNILYLSSLPFLYLSPLFSLTDWFNLHFLTLFAVVLTSPVLAMATYTTTEPPTCATNVDATWTKGYFMAIIRKNVVFTYFPSPALPPIENRFTMKTFSRRHFPCLLRQFAPDKFYLIVYNQNKLWKRTHRIIQSISATLTHLKSSSCQLRKQLLFQK